MNGWSCTPRQCNSLDGASLGPTPPCGVTRRQGNADLWPVLPVGAPLRPAPSGPLGFRAGLHFHSNWLAFPVRTHKKPAGGGGYGERRLPLPVGSRSMVTGVR